MSIFAVWPFVSIFVLNREHEPKSQILFYVIILFLICISDIFFRKAPNDEIEITSSLS